MSLNILVCIKQALDPDQTLQITGSPAEVTALDPAPVYQPGRADRVALEAALQLKEIQPVKITVLSIGPACQPVQEVLRLGLAAGADHAIHLVHADGLRLDPWAAARRAADTVLRSGSQLVLCGDTSPDDASGVFGPFLAEMLGWPLVTRMLEMSVDPATGSLSALRLLERGDRQRVRCALPAVVCASPLGYEPRYISVQRQSEAQARPIEQISVKSEAEDGQLKLVEVAQARPRPRRMPMPAASLSAAQRMKFLMGKDQPKAGGKEKIFEGPVEAAVDRIEQYLKEQGLL